MIQLLKNDWAARPWLVTLGGLVALILVAQFCCLVAALVGRVLESLEIDALGSLSSDAEVFAGLLSLLVFASAVLLALVGGLGYLWARWTGNAEGVFVHAGAFGGAAAIFSVLTVFAAPAF